MKNEKVLKDGFINTETILGIQNQNTHVIITIKMTLLRSIIDVLNLMQKFKNLNENKFIF